MWPMYADDHQKYFSGTSIESAASALKKSHKMYHSGIRPISSITSQANPNKYQIVVIAPHLDDNDTRDTCTLKIENQQIKPNTNLKIPGFNMDSELSFRDRISDICKKASQKVGVLMRLLNVIPRRPNSTYIDLQYFRI